MIIFYSLRDWVVLPPTTMTVTVGLFIHPSICPAAQELRFYRVFVLSPALSWHRRKPA